MEENRELSSLRTSTVMPGASNQPGEMDIKNCNDASSHCCIYGETIAPNTWHKWDCDRHKVLLSVAVRDEA